MSACYSWQVFTCSEGRPENTLRHLTRTRDANRAVVARGVEDVVFALSDAERPAAIAVADRLRQSGRSVDLVLGSPKLKRVMTDAGKSGASRVWLIGPDELARGIATVRDLASGEQTEELLQR